MGYDTFFQDAWKEIRKKTTTTILDGAKNLGKSWDKLNHPTTQLEPNPMAPGGRHLSRWSIDFEMAKVSRHRPRHVTRLGKT